MDGLIGLPVDILRSIFATLSLRDLDALDSINNYSLCKRLRTPGVISHLLINEENCLSLTKGMQLVSSLPSISSLHLACTGNGSQQSLYLLQKSGILKLLNTLQVESDIISSWQLWHIECEVFKGPYYTICPSIRSIFPNLKRLTINTKYLCAPGYPFQNSLLPSTEKLSKSHFDAFLASIPPELEHLSVDSNNSSIFFEIDDLIHLPVSLTKLELKSSEKPSMRSPLIWSLFRHTTPLLLDLSLEIRISNMLMCTRSMPLVNGLALPDDLRRFSFCSLSDCTWMTGDIYKGEPITTPETPIMWPSNLSSITISCHSSRASHVCLFGIAYPSIFSAHLPPSLTSLDLDRVYMRYIEFSNSNSLPIKSNPLLTLPDSLKTLRLTRSEFLSKELIDHLPSARLETITATYDGEGWEQASFGGFARLVSLDIYSRLSATHVSALSPALRYCSALFPSLKVVKMLWERCKSCFIFSDTPFDVTLEDWTEFYDMSSIRGTAKDLKALTTKTIAHIIQTAFHHRVSFKFTFGIFIPTRQIRTKSKTILEQFWSAESTSNSCNTTEMFQPADLKWLKQVGPRIEILDSVTPLRHHQRFNQFKMLTAEISEIDPRLYFLPNLTVLKIRTPLFQTPADLDHLPRTLTHIEIHNTEFNGTIDMSRMPEHLVHFQMMCGPNGLSPLKLHWSSPMPSDNSLRYFIIPMITLERNVISEQVPVGLLHLECSFPIMEDVEFLTIRTRFTSLKKCGISCHLILTGRLVIHGINTVDLTKLLGALSSGHFQHSMCSFKELTLPPSVTSIQMDETSWSKWYEIHSGIVGRIASLPIPTFSRDCALETISWSSSSLLNLNSWVDTLPLTLRHLFLRVTHVTNHSECTYLPPRLESLRLEVRSKTDTVHLNLRGMPTSLTLLELYGNCDIASWHNMPERLSIIRLNLNPNSLACTPSAKRTLLQRMADGCVITMEEKPIDPI